MPDPDPELNPSGPYPTVPDPDAVAGAAGGQRRDGRVGVRRADERRLAAVVEGMSEAFLSLDREWRVTYANREACRLNDTTPAGLLGHDHWERWPETVGSEVERRYRQVAATGVPARFEHYYPGVDAWHAIQAYPAEGGGLAVFYRDVSADRAAVAERERLLAEAERARRSTTLILSAVGEGVLGIDLDGRNTFVNDAAGRLLGYPPDELRGIAQHSHVHHHHADGRAYDEADCPILETLRTGVACRVSTEVFWRRDGSAFPVTYTSTPIVEGGRVTGAVVTFEDVTAQRTAESELRAAARAAESRERAVRESEARLRLALSSGGLGWWEWDTATGVVRWSPEVEAMHGLAPGTFGGTFAAVEETIHPDDRARVREAVARAVANREPRYSILYRFLRRGADGRTTVRWLEGEARLFLTEAGKPGRLLGVVGDATERVELLAATESARAEAEAARAESERARERTVLLQSLTAALSTASTLEEVAEAVVAHATAVFGAVGTVIARLSEDGIYLELMRAGAMPDDARDQWSRFPVSARVPLADVARSGEPIFLCSLEEWAVRYPDLDALVRASGHQANAIAPLVVDGRVLGVIGAAFDAPHDFGDEERALTLAVAHQCAQALERARLFDAERSARAEAEAANRAKGEFLAVMSHELRTPLNAIGGYAELMEMGIRGPVTPLQQDDLRRIQTSQRHLLGLINEVLNYAKLETGTVHYDVVDVRVREALATAEALVAPQARAKGLTLVVAECAGSLEARADREKLRQILVNLLSNAVKFTDPGGTIEMSGVSAGPDVRVRVRDTGIGIAGDKHEVIFDPFVQVRADLTRPHEGTGLGLAISRDLARGMGGDLAVESALGRGSTFTLTLPRA